MEAIPITGFWRGERPLAFEPHEKFVRFPTARTKGCERGGMLCLEVVDVGDGKRGIARWGIKVSLGVIQSGPERFQFIQQAFIVVVEREKP